MAGASGGAAATKIQHRRYVGRGIADTDTAERMTNCAATYRRLHARVLDRSHDAGEVPRRSAAHGHSLGEHPDTGGRRCYCEIKRRRNRGPCLGPAALRELERANVSRS